MGQLPDIIGFRRFPCILGVDNVHFFCILLKK